MAMSGVIHAALLGAAVLVARQTGVVPSLRLRPSELLTFVELTPPPPVIRTPPLRVPPVVRAVQPLALPPRVELKEPEPEKPRPEPPKPALEPRPAPRAAAPEPPKPAPPIITVGAFALNESARASETRALQAAEFDSPAARAPEIKITSTAVGAFEQGRVSGRPQPGTDRPNVSEAGFGAAAPTGRGRVAAGVVTDGGFGGGVPGGPVQSPAGVVTAGGFESGKNAEKPAPPKQTVKTSDFDAREALQKRAQGPRQPTQVPLEILSKPTPTYTAEARTLKIEGEVLLEVEFTATGTIRVMRVLRGLGHGLDEAATRAVQGVRFKPALRDGEPIDVRTTVNIVFRLA